MANRKSVSYRVIAEFPEAKELIQHIICRLKVSIQRETGKDTVSRQTLPVIEYYTTPLQL